MAKIAEYEFYSSNCNLVYKNLSYKAIQYKDNFIFGQRETDNSWALFGAFQVEGDLELPSSTEEGDPAYSYSVEVHAFEDCTSLTSITIPNSVTSIGNSAFFNCYKLVEVINKSSLDITEGSYDNGRVAYDAIEVHTGTSKIVNKDGYLFYTCGGVNYLIDYVGDDTDLILPENYNGESYEIYKYAFRDCYSLKSVTIPNSVTSIGEEAFYDCRSLTSVTIGNGVTSIGSAAFAYCDNLTSVTIGNSVTSISNSAFNECRSLTSVYITDIAKWCGISFDNYTANPLFYAHNLYLNGELVTELEIPDSVMSIGDFAFNGCDSFMSVEIPNSVTLIGYAAFAYCDSLKSVTIPNSVTSIGEEAFYDCNGLMSVSFKENSNLTCIADQAFGYCTSLTSITIPDSVTSIGSGTFRGCSSLESLTIPFVGGSKSATRASTSTLFGYIFGTAGYDGGVYTKQYYAPSGYTAYYIPSSLKSVTITGGNIFYGVFWNCTGLTSVALPDSITSIGNSVFFGCEGLQSITIPFVGAAIDEESTTHFGYLFGAINNDYVPSNLKTVIIRGGSSIGNYAFEDCTSLTSVTIPDSVTSIGNNAFLSCHSLTSVTIPNSVTRIGNSAFQACSSLTSVTIGNSVTDIGKLAFAACDSLKSVTIPNSVISIGEKVFSHCDSLTSVIIGNKITSISKLAFANCISLTSIEIPNGITSIGNQAFENCDRLTIVVIPDSVTTIGDYAFHGCDSLVSVVIGNKVTTIGTQAFYNCSKLLFIIDRSLKIKYTNLVSDHGGLGRGDQQIYHYWSK